MAWERKAIDLMQNPQSLQAKHFIYIENQYFLGGSGEWQDSTVKDICNQLIPIEV